MVIFNTYNFFQETLKELFQSRGAVERRYREVVIFVAGLMKDSRPLVQYICEMQVEHGPYIDADLFRSLQAESIIPLFDHPLHNKYINYYDHNEDERKKRPFDTTPVYCPSRLYHFRYMNHGAVLEDHLTQREKIPPCTMWISSPDEAVSDSLLSICSQIWKHQPVTDLRMSHVTCNSLEAPRLIKPAMVRLFQCKLPEDFMQILLRQLQGCRETLQELWLWGMNLAPFESLIDELLEDLVAHHEVGLAQRKLRLGLGGGITHPTSLSEEFKKKWWNRCEKVDSIDCRIDP